MIKLGLVLLLLLISVGYISCNPSESHIKCVGTNQTEYNALLALYSSTNGKNWMLFGGYGFKNNWNQTSNYCSWIGVLCNCVGNTPNPAMPFDAVIGVSVYNSNLVGTLPNQISDLTYLLSLDVSDNMDLEGTLPDISNLVFLQGLNLGNTALSGVIKTNMFSQMPNLFTLTLGPSYLSGNLGDFYNGCANLVSFDVRCSAITSMNLYNCNNMTQLYVIDTPIKYISNNPDSLCGFSGMMNLYLRNTNLNSDTVNLNCLTKLLYLQVIDISYNNFSGVVPSLNPTIYQMYMSNNNFNYVPDLSNLVFVRYIDLSYNNLSELPVNLPPMVSTFLLNNNNIVANIDDFVSSVTRSIFVNISSNNFYGYVKYQHNSNLQVLDVRHNPNVVQPPVDETNCQIYWDYGMPYLITDESGYGWLCPSGVVTHGDLMDCGDPTRYRIYVDPTFTNYQECASVLK